LAGNSFLCRWDPRALGQEDSKGILKKEKIELPAEEANVILPYGTNTISQKETEPS